MAARLKLKLGIVAEHDRLDDSPDTLVVVEPSVGSVARSKGNLYLLVTSRTSSRHALEMSARRSSRRMCTAAGVSRWRSGGTQRVTNGFMTCATALIAAGGMRTGGRFLPVTSSNMPMISSIVRYSLAKM